MFSRPQPVSSTESTYSILRTQFVTDWPQKYGFNSTGNFLEAPLEPLPFYRLSKRCLDQTLLILPFEQLIYQTPYKEITRGTTGVTKNGTRVLIYGMDFKNQKVNLLFDSLLVDFHGSIDSQSNCPDLLVTLRNKKFRRLAFGVGYTRLKFNKATQLFIPDSEEIYPNAIHEK